MKSAALMRGLALRRLALPKPDRRTPAQRIRDNEEMVRSLEGRLPGDLHQHLVELLAGSDMASQELRRALGEERYLDVCEACVVMDQER
jgi:hypothetical protein